MIAGKVHVKSAETAVAHHSSALCVFTVNSKGLVWRSAPTHHNALASFAQAPPEDAELKSLDGAPGG